MSSVCNLQIGLANSTPRLLIATDSKRWFVSQAGEEKFTQIKLSKLLILLYNEIKVIRLKTIKIAIQRFHSIFIGDK